MADSSKTEKATPKRRRDERKRGHVPLSRDVVAVATLVTAYAMLSILGPTIVASITEFMRYCIGEMTVSGLGLEAILDNLGMQIVKTLAITVALFAVCIITAAVVATFSQTKMLITTEPLKPKLSKLNPIQGFKKLFSLKSVIETLKSLLKILVLIVIVYSNLLDVLSISHKYLYTDISASVTHVFESVLALIFKIIIAFTVIAAADYFLQKWQYERDLRMSKQEIKEEFKQMEGDPKIKGKIKERQRQMALSRMMQQVPQADVVIRHPTHYAVALRYKPETDNAPIVLAMGQDALALRIVKVAEENNVAVIENVPLARALYAGAELNREIPPEFYGAVAEILVYIFRLSDKKLVK